MLFTSETENLYGFFIAPQSFLGSSTEKRRFHVLQRAKRNARVPIRFIARWGGGYIAATAPLLLTASGGFIVLHASRVGCALDRLVIVVHANRLVSTSSRASRRCTLGAARGREYILDVGFSTRN